MTVMAQAGDGPHPTEFWGNSRDKKICQILILEIDSIIADILI
jgi:hypothetical protein